MTHATALKNPQVLSFYSYQTGTPSPGGPELPTCVIAPHYAVQRAFNSAGQLSTQSRLGSAVTNIERLVANEVTQEDPTRFSLSQATTATVVDFEDVSLFGSIGTGPSKTTFQVSGTGRVIRKSTGLMEANAGEQFLTLTDTSANFPRILVKNSVPLLGIDVRRPHLFVRVVGENSLFPVELESSVSTEYPTRLVAIRYASNTSTAINDTVEYELVYDASSYGVSEPGAPAEIKLYSVERPSIDSSTAKSYVELCKPGKGSVLTASGGPCYFVNTSTAAFTLTVASGLTPEVTVPLATTATLTVPAASPLTLAAINDLLISAYAPNAPPVFLYEMDATGGSTIQLTSGAVSLQAAQRCRIPFWNKSVTGEVDIEIETPSTFRSILDITGSGDDLTVKLTGRASLIQVESALDVFGEINTFIADDTNNTPMYANHLDVLVTPTFRADLTNWGIFSRPGTPIVTGGVLWDDPTAGTTSLTTAVLAQSVNNIVEIEATAPGTAANGRSVSHAIGLANSVEVTADGIIITHTSVDGKTVSDSPDFEDLFDAIAASDNGAGEPVYSVSRIWVPSDITGRMEEQPLETGISAVNSVKISYSSQLGPVTVSSYDSGTTSTVNLPVAEESEFAFGSNTATLIVYESRLLTATNNLAVTFHADYRALRLDSTAITSLSTYGRAADLIQVNRDNYEQVLGEVSTRNPLAMIAYEFFQTANNQILYCLGVSEVGEVGSGDEMGTAAAIQEAFDLISRRNVYHIGVFSTSPEVLEAVVEFADDMAGTTFDVDGENIPRPRKKGLFFYVAQKMLTKYPDLAVSEGSVTYITSPGRTVLRTTLTASEFNDADLDAGRLAIVFRDFPEIEEGDAVLDNGRKGFTIVLKNAGSNVYALELAVALPVSVTVGAEFDVYRVGSGLVTGGVLNHTLATEALRAYHTLEGRYHFSVQKCFSGPYSVLRAGTETTLPPEYFTARYLGMVAVNSFSAPLSNARVSGVVAMGGTNAEFNAAELESLAGTGLTFSIQKLGSSSPVTIFRDVSSDTSTPTFTRRTAKVVDDLLDLRLNSRIQPQLIGAVISSAFIDSLMIQTAPIVEAMSDKYNLLSLEGFVPMTDADRQRFNVNERGIVAVVRRIPLEEVGVVIFNNFILNA